MFGGMGGGGSTLRNVRVGALAVFVVLGLALHRSGSAYSALHTVYFIVIAALIVASIASRGRRQHGDHGDYGPPGGSRHGRGSFGSGPPPGPLPTDNPDPEAGAS
jgi:hypothetical protein